MLKKYLKYKRYRLGLALFLPLFFFCASGAWAAEGIVFDGSGSVSAIPPAAVSAPAVSGSSAAVPAVVPEISVFSLTKEVVSSGFSAAAAGGIFKISLASDSVFEPAELSLQEVKDALPLPWNLEKITPVFQYDILPNAAYNGSRPLVLEMPYGKDNNGYKQIYFFDANFQSWRALPSVDYPKEKMVRATTTLVFARVAVFSDPSIMAIGKASFYSYKNGLFAASPDFPKGSKLRVHNLDNGKFVDIIVNDYGPERDKHPDRAIDLDKIAFKKISAIGAGLVNVKIEPLYIAPDVRGRVLGVSEKGVLSEPDVRSRAGLVMNEATGEVLWQKDADRVLPLASLSKLIAVKVFFDQRPSLNKVVSYKKQDELYNYKYCKPYESSKLNVKEGETMTLEDLVYSSLVGSANNAVESLVRSSGLPRESFIAKMNEFAAGAGATNTRFVEPTGLSSENVSTARDYALMMREIYKNPVIVKISTMPKYTFRTINTKKPHTLYNTNTFIREGVFAAANKIKITGSKTGYLDWHYLMTRATGAKGEQVLVVDMGADTKTQALEEVKEMIRYGVRAIGNGFQPALASN